jgi:hypothetical protein
VGIAIYFIFIARYIIRISSYSANEECKAIITEGSDLIQDQLINAGAAFVLKKSGRIMIGVLHSGGNCLGRASEINEKLRKSGLERLQYELICTPDKHPITMREAKIVIDNMARKGIKSAFLATDGFHEARSYLVYQQYAEAAGIKIIPKTIFVNYSPDKWWVSKKGVHELFDEIIKINYYLVKRYIPFSSLIKEIART